MLVLIKSFVLFFSGCLVYVLFCLFWIRVDEILWMSVTCYVCGLFVHFALVFVLFSFPIGETNLSMSLFFWCLVLFIAFPFCFVIIWWEWKTCHIMLFFFRCWVLFVFLHSMHWPLYFYSIVSFAISSLTYKRFISHMWIQSNDHACQ